MPDAVNTRAGILERVRVDRALLSRPSATERLSSNLILAQQRTLGNRHVHRRSGLHRDQAGEQASFHFEFEGGPFDACNGRTPVGQQATWIVDGKFPQAHPHPQDVKSEIDRLRAAA